MVNLYWHYSSYTGIAVIFADQLDHSLLYVSTDDAGTYTTSGVTDENAPAFLVGGVVGRLVMVLREVQPLKQYSPIDVTALGMMISLSLTQLSKARLPSFIEGANVTSSKFEHLWNAIRVFVIEVNRENSLNFVMAVLPRNVVPMEFHRNRIRL